MGGVRGTLEKRLESWREVVRTGRPVWLAVVAPRIVAELEAEIAAERGHNGVRLSEEVMG